ncbi:hypothetical protein BJY04DRAFT_191517 [Aspergillus karnatakaensis]|uniref:hydrophobin family protein n=1 Tax=Aspergillus karnatakaensis TaxID=1810916 RepID=UPI003CCD6771
MHLGASILAYLAMASNVLAKIPASECSEQLLCCQSLQHPSGPAATTVLGLLGIVLGPTGQLAGLTCDRIAPVGGMCSAEPVCCLNNNFNGLIALNCEAVDLSA